MQSIPLGLITILTAGTPVGLTLSGAQAALLAPGGLCSKVVFSPNPANTGNVSIKQGGVVLDTLLKPANGVTGRWSTPCTDYNCINPLAFQLDVATNNDGAYVTLWVL
jgi:hypothetical protein